MNVNFPFCCYNTGALQFGAHPDSISGQTIPLTHWSYSLLEMKDVDTGDIVFEEKSVSSPYINV